MRLLNCVSGEGTLPVCRYYTRKHVYEVAVSLCLTANVKDTLQVVRNN